MKHLLTLLTALLLTISASAAHLEFMRIPLTGTITAFQSKLQSKGCRLHKYGNKVGPGCKGFVGVFAGENADIFVHYNHRTQQVYKVNVSIECSSLEAAESTFNRLKKLLDKKYLGVALTSDMVGENTNEYEFDLMIFEPPIQAGSPCVGTILLLISQDDSSGAYRVIVSYEDEENAAKNEQSTLDDL